MNNDQGDYDQNIAEEAGYAAGRFGTYNLALFRPPFDVLFLSENIC